MAEVETDGPRPSYFEASASAVKDGSGGGGGDFEFSAAAKEVLLVAVLFLALFRTFCATLASKTFQRRFPLPGEGDQKDVANKCASAAFAFFASFTGSYLLLFGGRPGQNHPHLIHIFYIAMGYFHYDLYAMYVVFEAQWREGRESGSALWAYLRRKFLIVAHHVVVGSVLTPIMATRLDHEPGELMVACALVMEGSTPFVSARAVMSHLGMKRTKAYLINGVLMLAAFFSCRVLVYPAFFVAYARHRPGLTALSAAARVPAWPCGVCLVAVLAPQLYWFRAMVKGAVKVLEDRKKPEEKNGDSPAVAENKKNGKLH